MYPAGAHHQGHHRGAATPQQPRRHAARSRVRLRVGGSAGRIGASCKRGLDARIATGGTVIEDWRLHDFRRTVSTVMHDKLEVFPHIVEAVLAHVDGHRRGVAGVYNKADLRRGQAHRADQMGGLRRCACQWPAAGKQRGPAPACRSGAGAMTKTAVVAGLLCCEPGARPAAAGGFHYAGAAKTADAACSLGNSAAVSIMPFS